MLLVRSHFKNELNYQHPISTISESTFILKDLIIPIWMSQTTDFIIYFLKRIQDFQINTGKYYFFTFFITFLISLL